MKGNMPAAFKGTYELFLTRKDKLLQHVTVHNVPCKGIATVQANAYHIKVGNGSGTPSFSDTQLFSQLWDIWDGNKGSSIKISAATTPSPDDAKHTITCIIPAVSDFVGTITELGVGDEVLSTHALLSDAEGKPIAIEKTRDDQLTIIITIEVHVTRNLPVQCLYEPWMRPSVYRSYALFMLLVSVGDGWTVQSYFSYLHTYGWQFRVHGKRIAFSLCNLLNDQPAVYASVTDTDPVMLSFSNSTDSSTVRGSLRFLPPTYNTHYYRFIQLLPCGTERYDYRWRIGRSNEFIDLIGSGLFTQQPLNGVVIGTGDGVQTAFKCPVNYFKKDTDVLYVNGVKQTRGVDYTIDNLSNKDHLSELVYLPYTLNASKISGPCVNGERIMFAVAPCNFQNGDDSNYAATRITTEAPILIDWGEARVCDSLIGRLNANKSCTLHIAYQVGSEWREVHTCTLNGTLDLDEHWTGVSAQKWRLSLTAESAAIVKCADTSATNYAYFGHTNKNAIVFSTPPAEAATITLDCATDIPFKNENFALDISIDATITYGALEG